MAHTPEYLTLTVTWDHPGLREALETIIAKAWAEGFRIGVNDEREGKRHDLPTRYRDWRGYGPGVNHPGGASASERIRAEDGARSPDSRVEIERLARVKQPRETQASRRVPVRVSCGCRETDPEAVYTRLTGEMICKDCYDKLI